MTDIPRRKILKANAAELLSNAQVSPKKVTALYLGLCMVLSLLTYLSGVNIISTFLTVLIGLLTLVLDVGFTLYCMTIRRGQKAEYFILFDGFSNIGKIILLEIVKTVFTTLWSMLFVIPGIIAYYRYRFALYYLLEDPDLGVMEALELSKRQSFGYKGALFALDLSYLGWGILAGLPDIIYRTSIQVQTAALMANGYEDLQEIIDAVSMDVFGISVWVWRIIIPLFALLISLFYLPNYRCVELDYFDSAKNAGPLGSRRDSVLWDSRRSGDDSDDSTGNSSFGDY